MDFKDARRRDKFNKTEKHFSNSKNQSTAKQDMTKKDQIVSESRLKNRLIAEETMAIIQAGTYTYNGAEIDMTEDLNKCIKDTITYLADELPLDTKFKPQNTVFEVNLETTFAGSRRCTLLEKDIKVCALNFASAKNPGGGFLNGAVAQEESLARGSGLYPCIADSQMYKINAKDNNYCLYSDTMIYSPNVPVFRDDNDKLIEEPYLVSIITAPAPNAKIALTRNQTWTKINNTVYYRAEKLLSIAAFHQQDVIVLGSWGCGVFGGNIDAVADIFYQLLTTKYKGAFKRVVFSTLSKFDYEIFISYFGDL
jgi:uncharacterized protein (TIGR02452 family)